MSLSREKNKFESRFTEDVTEIAAVTGASGIGAGRGGGAKLWNASIPLIAWKNVLSNETKIEELRLEWQVNDEEWERSKDILKKNTIVRLLVRRSEHSMMLVKVLEAAYKDDELEMILQDSLKPVFYMDKVLGEFELDKSVKTFEKKVLWAGEEGNLYFDWDADESGMKAALETAYALFENQEEWNMKIRRYAAEELTELANDWLQDNEEAEIDEITNKMFMDLMELNSISVYSDGDFNFFFFDGDMFWGHSIIVSGNIHGDLTSAEIAG
ncbi:DUF2262 domain-containing protein [Cytobacillus massiliigabonensis]|uniref:DUF2262 domain-containing protein n=1 Tax=Cytobacillus massiliigabonensis TaxID=1871011 RepID=UPI000C8404C8|nr:DUF2262 domain-containing protein [Cytobacillus massiliigabonensis]